MKRTELRRKTPLAPVSAKKLAALQTSAASGIQSTKVRCASRRPRSTGPDRNTVDAVLERDSWSCVVCGYGIKGERGVHWSIGHRRPRRAGGDRRPDTNLPANLITLHGSGTTGCHGDIESKRIKAQAWGLLLAADDIPSAKRVKHAVHGWCYLLNDGSVRRIGDV